VEPSEVEAEDLESDIEIEEVEVEVEVDIDDGETNLNFNDIHDTEQYVAKKQRRHKIQRFCKSVKESVPRKQTTLSLTVDMTESILAMHTTANNARIFAPYCTSREELYQWCGKFIQKDFPFSEFYKEVSQHVSPWESQTFRIQKIQEQRDIDIMTVKLPVSEGLYTCSRCKSTRTFSRQVQTRSADEGMTSIIQCSECKKVWREYA